VFGPKLARKYLVVLQHEAGSEVSFVIVENRPRFELCWPCCPRQFLASRWAKIHQHWGSIRDSRFFEVEVAVSVWHWGKGRRGRDGKSCGLGVHQI
jgi:hypothetical protein